MGISLTPSAMLLNGSAARGLVVLDFVCRKRVRRSPLGARAQQRRRLLFVLAQIGTLLDAKPNPAQNRLGETFPRSISRPFPYQATQSDGASLFRVPVRPTRRGSKTV